jgi:hypothetical protein
MMPLPFHIYAVGDRVRMEHRGRWQHGKIMTVFQGPFLEFDQYAVLFDDGDWLERVRPYSLEPENPLDSLARCGE